MPDPPIGVPEPRPTIGPAPPTRGINQETRQDFYEWLRDKLYWTDNDEWERILGLETTVGLNTKTELVKGWAHNTFLTWGYNSYVVGFENKFNGGFVANFVRNKQLFVTKGNRTVLTLGVRVLRVSGTSLTIEGWERKEDTVVGKKRLEKRTDEFWKSVEKQVAAEVKRQVKDLKVEHKKLQATIARQETKCKQLSVQSNNERFKAKNWKEDVKKFLEECDEVDVKVKGKCQIISKAAADFIASAQMKVKVKSKATLLGKSLAEFGGAIIKLG